MSSELTVSEAVRLRQVSLLLAGRGRARAAFEAAAAEHARFLGRTATVSWGERTSQGCLLASEEKRPTE